MTYANQSNFTADDLEVEPADNATPPKLCKNCNNQLKPKRSTKLFCSDNCRKNNSRPIQNAQSSPTKAREQMEYYDRVNYSYELYLYNRTQEQRDEWIQAYIDNPTTKRIVCNPALLNAKTINIAKIAHRYVMKTYGVSIKDYY